MPGMYIFRTRKDTSPAPRGVLRKMHICLSMKKLLGLMLPLMLAVGMAQPSLAQLRTGAGYDCEEEIFPRYDKATRTYGYVNMVGIWRVDPAFTKAERFSGKLAVVQRGTKFGLLNCQGNLVANTIYDEIQNFVNGRGWARQGTLWGLLDDKGRLVVPPAFEDIRPVTPRNELTWVKKKGVWGIFSKDRIKMVVEPRYDACRSLSDSLGLGLQGGYVSPIYLGTGQVIYDSCAFFTKAGGNTYRFSYRGKEGLMEATGTVLMRPEYERIENYTNYILAKKHGKWAVATLLGKLETALEYDSLAGSDGVLIAGKKGIKWGFMLPTGKTFLPLEYDGAVPEHAQYYAVKKGTGNKAWALNKVSDKLTDSDFAYYGISFPFGNKAVVLAVNDSVSIMMSLQSGQLYPEEFTLFSWGDSTNYVDVMRGSFHGTIKHGMVYLPDFNLSLPMQYPSFVFCAGYKIVRVKESQGCGLLNLSNKKYIIKPEYTFVTELEGTSNFIAGKDGKSYIFNGQGKQLAVFDADFVEYYKSGIYRLKRDTKYGLIQAPDKIILKPQFDKLKLAGTVKERGNLPLIAFRKHKAQLYAADGKEISATYDSIYYVGQSFFSAKKGNSYFFLNSAGKEVNAEPYDQIYAFTEGLCLVVDKGKKTYLNRSLKPAFILPLEEAGSYLDGAARVKLAGQDHYVLINKAGKTVQILP